MFNKTVFTKCYNCNQQFVKVNKVDKLLLIMCSTKGTASSIWLKPFPFSLHSSGSDRYNKSFSHDIYICIQFIYIPTNQRHALICFMRAVTLQYWMLHRKQAWILLKSSNIFSKAVKVLPKMVRSKGRVKITVNR